MSDVVARKSAQRTALLKAIYTLMDGEPGSESYTAMHKCGEDLGLSSAETESAFRWLVSQEFCEDFTSDAFNLTREGVQAIEDLMSGRADERAPDPPVTMHISGGTFGAIQTGAHNTSHFAQQINNGIKVDDVLALLGKLRAAAHEAGGEHREEAIELVDAIEEQAKSPTPKLARVKSYAETLKVLLVAYAPMITEVVHAFASKAG